MLSILSYVSGASVCPPWRSVCLGPLPSFWLVVCLSGVGSCEFFIYFGDQALVWGIIGKYVFPHCLFSFHFNVFFFSVQKLFILMRSHLFILSFMSLALGDISVKILLHEVSEIFLPTFSFRTFMVLQLIFKSFIHLEFIFVCGISWWLSFIFFACSYPHLWTPLIEEAIFIPFYASAPFVKY